MKRGLIVKLFFVLLVVAGSIWVDQPIHKPLNWKGIKRDFNLQRGLDLAGGTRLVYEADLSKIGNRKPSEAVTGVISVIDRRINALGVSEPLIQSTQIGDKRGVVVELPGLSNAQEAINLIGKTAQLEFWEERDGQLQPTDLTGADLTEARLDIESGQANQVTSQLTAEPVVLLKFSSEGAKKFSEITKRNLGKQLAIVIDGVPISAPTVQSQIDTGDAIITGIGDIKEGRQLTIALQAGALPVPINLVAQSTIGPTLGQSSVERSIVAGLIGLSLVVIFMISYYRLSGLFASIALIFYGLIVFALFKLVPITITLAGITGFILSIGMAVDANILIFERLKEELRKGKPMQTAIDEGFARAWSSIRDSNVSSIITALILFWFGSSMIRGFALTLIIGILVSMFTAINVSRIFLKLFLRERHATARA